MESTGSDPTADLAVIEREVAEYLAWAEADVPRGRTFEDWHDKAATLLRWYAAAHPAVEERLIAPCPSCGDEFDVTDEAGRLRTEAHWERHHAPVGEEGLRAALKRAASALAAVAPDLAEKGKQFAIEEATTAYNAALVNAEPGSARWVAQQPGYLPKEGGK